MEILAAVEWSDIDDLIHRAGWLALILEQGWNKKSLNAFQKIEIKSKLQNNFLLN
ncbi:MAG: hypothetical protein ACFFC7_27415 [Candidatus Hermodarchaeota archaeon]